MSIFGPFTSSIISPVTFTDASAFGSAVTVVPSTTRTAGKETVDPAAEPMRSTVMVSPTVTFSWRPPAFTIAYTLLLQFS